MSELTPSLSYLSYPEQPIFYEWVTLDEAIALYCEWEAMWRDQACVWDGLWDE